jgi:hypothetical protein
MANRGITPPLALICSEAETMKKIDLKPFLIEKGERVGLYAAAGLSFLLVVMGLLKVLGAGSASANADKLNDQIKKIEDAQNRARPQPGTNDMPPPLLDVDAEANWTILAAAKFPARSLFESPPPKDSMRQKPTILAPDEFYAAYVRANLPALDFEFKDVGDKKVPAFVSMVKLPAGGMLGAAAAMGGNPGFQGPMNLKGIGNSFGSGGLGAFGNFGASGAGAGGVPGAAGVAGAAGARGLLGAAGGLAGARPGVRLPGSLRPTRTPKAAAGQGLKVETIPIAEAENGKPGYAYANRALPLRMAVVVASFPYKKQVEEFRQKLRYEKQGDVLTNQVKGEGNKTWNEFQFRGLIVERAVEEPGKPVKPEDYEAIPIDESARRILLLVFHQVEADDPQLKPIKDVSKGLVMGLPKQFPGHTYPKTVEKLTNISTTVEKLNSEEAKKTIVVPSQRFSTDFNPFDEGGANAAPGGAMGGVPGAGGGSGAGGGAAGTPPGGVMGGAARNMGGSGGFSGNQWVIQGQGPGKDVKETSIDHCLIRFFDVTLEPGKAYRYRFKVKMANPNYSPKPEERKDTYPQFAKDKELESEWVYVPTPVVVPPDSLIYAVDQAAVDRIRGARSPDSNEAVVQLHRWVDEYAPDQRKQGDTRPVGEWVVANRLFIRKGEYVRRLDVKTPIPIKPLESISLELDEKNPLDFGDETVLVDFEGGKTLYDRTAGEGEKAKREFVNDTAATELLMMTPEGKLITRVNALDELDSARVTRLNEYIKRVKDIREKKSDGGTNPIGGNPLGG